MELIELTFDFNKLMQGVSSRVCLNGFGHVLNEYPLVRFYHNFISAN